MKPVILMTIMAFAVLAMQAGCTGFAAKEDEAAIRRLLLNGCVGFVHKDLAGAMEPYGKDLYVFDIAPPEHGDYASLEQSNRQFLSAIDGTPTCDYRDMFVKVYGNNAYAHYILSFSAALTTGAKFDADGRGSDVLEKSGGRWRIVHEHFSVPVNLATGQAQLKSPRLP